MPKKALARPYTVREATAAVHHLIEREWQVTIEGATAIPKEDGTWIRYSNVVNEFGEPIADFLMVRMLSKPMLNLDEPATAECVVGFVYEGEPQRTVESVEHGTLIQEALPSLSFVLVPTADGVAAHGCRILKAFEHSSI